MSTSLLVCATAKCLDSGESSAISNLLAEWFQGFQLSLQGALACYTKHCVCVHTCVVGGYKKLLCSASVRKTVYEYTDVPEKA